MNSSQAKPTVEQIKEWDVDKLLDWIKEYRPNLVKVGQLEKLKAADISGDVFLNHASDMRFFKNECGLTAGASDRLANLASEFAEAGGETAVIKSKLLSFMSCTPRRQQANNVTGKRQQAEEVEMTDAADSKFLSFIPCTPQANNLGSLKVNAVDVLSAGIKKIPIHFHVSMSGMNWLFRDITPQWNEFYTRILQLHWSVIVRIGLSSADNKISFLRRRRSMVLNSKFLLDSSL